MPEISDHFVQRLFEKQSKIHPLDLMYEAQDISREVGFDFTHMDLVMGKVEEEVAELRKSYEGRRQHPEAFEDEIGDCFFSLINLVRHAGVDVDEILRRNSTKYLLRCEFIEKQLADEGKNWSDLPLEEIYRRWKEAKRYVNEKLKEMEASC